MGPPSGPEISFGSSISRPFTQAWTLPFFAAFTRPSTKICPLLLFSRSSSRTSFADFGWPPGLPDCPLAKGRPLGITRLPVEPFAAMTEPLSLRFLGASIDGGA